MTSPGISTQDGTFILIRDGLIIVRRSREEAEAEYRRLRLGRAA